MTISEDERPTMPTDISEIVARVKERVRLSQGLHNVRLSVEAVTALLAAAEAGVRARRTALEDAKAALKDLWFGDEVARPGSLDAIEAIDALLAASPTCNDSLQVQAAPTIEENSKVRTARDAVLEEAAQISESRALPSDGEGWKRACSACAAAIRALKGRPT